MGAGLLTVVWGQHIQGGKIICLGESRYKIYLDWYILIDGMESVNTGNEFSAEAFGLDLYWGYIGSHFWLLIYLIIY